MTNIERSKAF